MKRVGILTFVQAENYGTELQAFALQRKLCQLGYDAEVIDLKYTPPSSSTHYYVALIALLRRILRGDFASIVRIAARFVGPKKARPPESEACLERKREQVVRYQKFWEDTRRSAVSYTRERLYSQPPDYDVYVVGSDQVWSYRQTSQLDVFFLDFAKERSRKIAYAASFGVKAIPFLLRGRYRKGLRKFDAVSLRESFGVRLAGTLTLRPAEHVLDPTLLLTPDEWRQEGAPAAITGPYILLYSRSSSPNIIQVALDLSKQRGLPVVSIFQGYDTELYPTIINLYDAGPREFISLIEKASYVVTNSFHATVFAINFGVRFVAVVNPVSANNGRMESALSDFGLGDRLIDESVPHAELPGEIDYPKVHALLAAKREQSLAWLTSSIGVQGDA